MKPQIVKMNLPHPKSISAVIPTMNRAEVLLDTLRDLIRQEFVDFEVIVIDQSDEPNPAAEALMEEFNVPARYCFVSHFRGLPEARNYGWRIAVGDIIVFIDDDIRCEPNFLQAHYDAHLTKGAAMVAGGITEARGNTIQRGKTGSFNWWTATPGSNFHLKEPMWCISGKGANFSVRRVTLDELKGFDENLTVGASLYEETEFSLRVHAAGHRCWFAPEAHLTHLAAPMGGCRVKADIPHYVFGMGHNRAILIFRHLSFLHRPMALLRMLAYGLSYSRVDRSLAPLLSAVCGIIAGRKVAPQVKVESKLLSE